MILIRQVWNGLAETWLLLQEHTGLRTGVVWLACTGSLCTPSLSCVTGHSITAWPAALTLHRFQFATPNWNQIFLTLEINTVKQWLVHRINECLLLRRHWGGDGKAQGRFQPHSPWLGSSQITARAWQVQNQETLQVPEDPAAASSPRPQPVTGSMGQLHCKGEFGASMFLWTHQVFTSGHWSGLNIFQTSNMRGTDLQIILVPVIKIRMEMRSHGIRWAPSPINVLIRDIKDTLRHTEGNVKEGRGTGCNNTSKQGHQRCWQPPKARRKPPAATLIPDVWLPGVRKIKFQSC
jgi:hypothetical protein